MTKKNMLFAMLALAVAGCSGSGDGNKGDDKEKMMTADQKACVKQHKCDRAKSDEAKMCKKQAFEACGVDKADWKAKKETKVDSKGRRREMDRTNK